MTGVLMGSIDYVDVAFYVNAESNVYTMGAIENALDAEAAAQARKCRIEVPGTDLPVDLFEALLRRVARNLAMRNLPLGVQSNEAGAIRLGSVDPEIARLEAPYRRVVIG